MCAFNLASAAQNIQGARREQPQTGVESLAAVLAEREQQNGTIQHLENVRNLMNAATAEPKRDDQQRVPVSID